MIVIKLFPQHLNDKAYKLHYQHEPYSYNTIRGNIMGRVKKSKLYSSVLPER